MAFIKTSIHQKKVDISRRGVILLEFLNTNLDIFSGSDTGDEVAESVDRRCIICGRCGYRRPPGRKVFNFFCMTWSKLQFCYAC